MGKGDKKTRRGKIFMGSHGVLRRKGKNSAEPVEKPAKKVKTEKPGRPVKVKIKDEPVKEVDMVKPVGVEKSELAEKPAKVEEKKPAATKGKADKK